MKIVTLSKNKPIEPPFRRKGRPKNSWIKQTFEHAWEALDTNEKYIAAEDQIEFIIIFAEARIGPFKTKKKDGTRDI